MKILPFPAAATRRPAPPPRDRRGVAADYAPPGGAPITARQKTILVLAAREAARLAGAPDSGPAFDAWRRGQAIDACGLRISEARQRDWALLRAHFDTLRGRPDSAYRTLVGDSDNPRRIALHKLSKACAWAGVAMAYAGSICRRQYKVPLDQASAAQLWHLVFTVRNRRKEARA